MIDLKSIRVSLNKSQNEIAALAGISQQYYSFIESGTRGRKLPVPTAKKIAAVMGFEWQDFYREEKEESNK